MDTDPKYVGSLIVVLIVLVGTVLFAFSLMNYQYAQADASIEVGDEGTATVNVKSLGDAGEVIVKSGSNEKVVTETGEVSIEISGNNSVTVETPNGDVIRELEISGSSGDESSDNSGDESSDNVEITTEKLESTHDELVGSGTEEDPYLITTPRELQSIQVDPNSYYRLGQDIDASETSNWNSGKGFTPIQDFSGTFVGQDNTISNLTIHRSSSDNIGLFSVTNEAKIEGVTFEGVSIQGNNYVGVVAGKMQSSEISNVQVSGEVNGNDNVGGIAGLTNPTTVSNVTVTGMEVVGNSNSVGGISGVHQGQISGSTIEETTVRGDMTVGGIAGQTIEGAVISDVQLPESVDVIGTENVGGATGQLSDSGRIVRISSKAQVSASTNVGGLVGIMNSENTEVIVSKFTGQVEGEEVVGGAVGMSQAGSINNVYTRGSVDGSMNVGGLSGMQESGTTIVHSYTRADVSGAEKEGAIVGTAEGVSSSGVYWINTTQNPDSAVGSGSRYGDMVEESNVGSSTASEVFSDLKFDSVWSAGVDGPEFKSNITIDSVPKASDVIADSGDSTEGVPVELTISVVNQFGEDVTADVTVGKESYALIGERTVTVSGNSQYNVKTSSNGHIDKSKTVEVGTDPKTVEFELIKEGVQSELGVVLQDGSGNRIVGSISFENQSTNKIIEKSGVVDLETGKYKITAEAVGYESVTREIVLKKEQRKNVTFQLSNKDPETTQLAIRFVNPDQDLVSTTVRVDGESYEVEDGRKVFLVGKNKVVDVHPYEGEYIKQPQKVSVEDTPKSVTMELEEADVQLNLSITKPNGSEISGTATINGKLYEIPAGGKSITVQKYKEYNATITSQYREKVDDVIAIEDTGKSITYSLEYGTKDVEFLLQDSDGNPIEGTVNIDNDSYSVNGGITKTLDMGESYSVTANSRGYIKESQSLTPSKDTDQVVFKLNPDLVDLVVEIKDSTTNDPIVGSVTLGENTYNVEGSKTLEVQKYDTYDLTADSAGYQDKTKSITMDDTPRELTFSLQPEEVDLTIELTDMTNSEQLDGTLEFDGDTYSISGTRTIQVTKYTNYDITASKTDYQDTTKTVEMEGSDKSVTIQLEPEQVDLRIWLEDSATGESISGVVYIEGEKYGVDGDRTVTVYKNKDYEIEANAEGYESKTRTVSIGSSDTSEVFQLDEKTSS